MGVAGKTTPFASFQCLLHGEFAEAKYNLPLPSAFESITIKKHVEHALKKLAW